MDIRRNGSQTSAKGSFPGTTKLNRLEENLGAATVQLTSRDLADIRDALAHIDIEGERYPPELLATTGR
jgi:aryl-alcohol dehydrogenase-like predicted oxidoreductase